MSPTRTPRDDDRSNHYALDSEVDGEVIDDNDHLASVLRRKAIAAREVSARGLLASIEHRASFEGLPDDVVIDLGFVQAFARPASPEHARIAREVEPQLRAWLTSEHPGLRQRAHFALVLLQGPAAAAKLLSAIRKQKDGASLLGVLHALTSFASLPAELLPQLKALLDPAKLDQLVRDDDRGEVGPLVVDALVRVDSPEAMDVLLGALDNEEFRVLVAQRLESARRSSLPDGMMRQLRARFAQAVATIAGSRKDALPLPNRVAMSTAGGLARLVKRDAEMARQALSVFDLIPGPIRDPGVVTDLADLIAASIDDLTPGEHEVLAGQLMRPPPERLPATAAAWVRLEPATAAALAAKIRGGRDTTEPVWHALARAYQARGVHRPELRELIPARILPPE